MKKEKVLKFVRWLLVFPVFIVVYVVAYYIYFWIGDKPSTKFWESIEFLFALLFASTVSVILGSLTAPNKRKTVSVVLATTITVLMILGIIIQIFHFSNYNYWTLAGNIFSIIGAIAGSYVVYAEIEK